VKGKENKIISEDARANTPPNLEGTERRMVYANRKYHSGVI